MCGKARPWLGGGGVNVVVQGPRSLAKTFPRLDHRAPRSPGQHFSPQPDFFALYIQRIVLVPLNYPDESELVSFLTDEKKSVAGGRDLSHSTPGPWMMRKMPRSLPAIPVKPPAAPPTQLTSHARRRFNSVSTPEGIDGTVFGGGTFGWMGCSQNRHLG